MANPICLSPLKFYDSIDKWNHKKSYAYGSVAPLIMPFNTLDPFQFVLPNDVTNIVYAQLTSLKAKPSIVLATGFLNQLKEAGLKVLSKSHIKICVFPGLYPLSMVDYEGLYYLTLKDDKNNFYHSEPFCFSSKSNNLLTIEYWNPESDFAIKNGLITFTDNFHFKLRLNTELGKPEYNFEEEATKRLGYSFIESQVSKKIYKFNVVIPEYVCDAMRIIRLCSNKVITSFGETYDALSFDMSVDWQDQGDLASVNCEFETDNIIVNLGGYKYVNLGGDFNKDYNDDFETT